MMKIQQLNIIQAKIKLQKKLMNLVIKLMLYSKIAKIFCLIVHKICHNMIVLMELDIQKENQYIQLLNYLQSNQIPDQLYNFLYNNLANLKYQQYLDKQNKADITSDYLDLLTGCLNGLKSLDTIYNYSIYDILFINCFDELLPIYYNLTGVNQQQWFQRSSGLYLKLNNQTTYASVISRPYSISGNMLNKRYITNFKTNFSNMQSIQFSAPAGVFLPYEGIIQMQQRIHKTFINITYIQTIMANLNQSYYNQWTLSQLENKTLDIIKYYILIYETINIKTFTQLLTLYDQSLLVTALLYDGEITVYLENFKEQEIIKQNFIVLQNSGYDDQAQDLINITTKSDSFYIASNSVRYQLIQENINLLTANINNLYDILLQNPVTDDYREGFAPRYDLSDTKSNYGSVYTKQFYYGIPNSTQQFNISQLNHFSINNFTNEYDQSYPLVIKNLNNNQSCQNNFNYSTMCLECIQNYTLQDGVCIFKYDLNNNQTKNIVLDIVMVTIVLILFGVILFLYIFYKLV